MAWIGDRYEIGFFEKCRLFGNLEELPGLKDYDKLDEFDVSRVATGSYVGIEAYRLQETFSTGPGPPGRQQQVNTE